MRAAGRIPLSCLHSDIPGVQRARRTLYLKAERAERAGALSRETLVTASLGNDVVVAVVLNLSLFI